MRMDKSSFGPAAVNISPGLCFLTGRTGTDAQKLTDRTPLCLDFVKSVPEKLKIFLKSKKVDDEYTKYGIIGRDKGQNLLQRENKHGG